MIRSLFHFGVGLSFCFFTTSSLLADKLYLTNGDVVSGSVISMEENRLKLESSIMGEITIPWESVKGIETNQPISLILQNGDRITGNLVSDHGFELQSDLYNNVTLPKNRIHGIGIESNIQLQNDLQSAKDTIDNISSSLSIQNKTVEELQTQLAEVTELDQLWGGSVSLMGGLKAGNREAFDLYFESEVVRETDTEVLTLRGDFGYGESEGVVDTTEGRVQSNLRVFFQEKTFAFGDVLFEHDRFEDLELRVDGTIGSGYQFWKTKDSHFSLDAGAGASHETFRSGGSDSEAILRFGAEFSKVLFGKTKFTQSLTVFPSVGAFGEARLISRSNFSTPILDSLSWNLSIIDEFDTDPRSADIKKNDVAVRTGLSYSF